MDVLFKQRVCLSYDELLQYKRGTIDDEQKNVIENHLLDCPLCADAVEGISALEYEEGVTPMLDEMKKELLKKHFYSRPSKNSRIYKLWMNRAVALILMGVLAFALHHYLEARQIEKLADEYYIAPVNDYLGLRSVDEQTIVHTPIMVKAIKFYGKEAYEQCIPYLEEHIASKPTDDQARLLLVSALLKEHESQKAESVLNNIESEALVVTNYKDWYYILAYLQQREVEKAIPILNKLKNTAPGFRHSAIELLEQLQ